MIPTGRRRRGDGDLGTLKDTALLAARLLARGQTNFVRMLWKFNSVYNPSRQLSDHRRAVTYGMRLPAPPTNGKVSQKELFVLQAQGAK